MIRLYFLPGVIFLSMIASHAGNGQGLPESRRSSYYTFIYRITNPQAQKLYRDVGKVETSYLNNLIDFYPTDSVYRKKLPVGHYVFVRSVAGTLQCELESVNNVGLKLLNNHRDLIAIFYDSAGRELREMEVRAGARTIPFDESTQSYRLRKSNKRGIIAAGHDGHISFFEIDRTFNNTFFVRMGRKIFGTFPINHILSPIFYTKDNVESLIRSGYVYPPGIYRRVQKMFQPRQHSGYIAFNKPMYKPGDTVRMKAYLTTRKGRPLNEHGGVHLTRYYHGSFDKKLGSIEAFRKGAYEFAFALADSLGLQLDDNYTVELRGKKNNILLSEEFRYEDYELKQNIYTVRSQNKTTGKPTLLFLRGSDSNEMPLYDVRVEILLRPKELNKYYQQHLFIPDTLWFHETRLEAVGETRIVVPDSVIPGVRMDCEAVVSFLNTENERTNKTLTLHFDKDPFPAVFDIRNDSLLISGADPAFTEELQLSGFDGEGRLFTRPVSLPHAEKLNPFIERYTVEYDGANRSVSLADKPDNFDILANRSVDAVLLVSSNPRKIPFRYFLFRNRHIAEWGETDSLRLKQKANPNDNYTLSVQYIWAGKAETREYEIPFDKKNLEIGIEHPQLVYPGQKATFTITVNDAFGEPVRGADLTAFAVTRKFQTDGIPPIPTYAKAARKRLVFNEFHKEQPELQAVKFLDYAYWRKKLGLDSIAFYNFLYPDTGYYRYIQPAVTAQFAPFVVSKGNLLAVRVIYVDGVPVYYKEVDTIEPYSFAIKPGKHRIDLRLPGSQLTMHEVEIDTAGKLIFSIDFDLLPSNCTMVKMPYAFTKDELHRLGRYFMLVTRNSSPSNVWIRQGDRYHLMTRTPNRYRNGELAGPFYAGKATYHQKDAFDLTFDYDPFFSYQFGENILKQRQVDIGGHLKRGYSWEPDQSPSFSDQVHTAESIVSYWKSLEEPTQVTFERFPEFTPAKPGRLILDLHPEGGHSAAVRATFVVNLDDPDEYYVFSGSIREIPFNSGHYQAVLIFRDERYIRVDSIFVEPYGVNYYDIHDAEIHPADTFSTRVMQMISKWSVEGMYIMEGRERELERIRALYYQQSAARYIFGHSVTGRVIDESGGPLPGVNVMVRGTAVGTTTDLDGFYRINCPSDGTLVFSFIGYMSKEEGVGRESTINVDMQPDIQQLSEVVVTGFGVQYKHSLAGSVTTMLQGRVAGIAIDGHSGLVDSIAIKIRGVSSLAGREPLVILDGKLVSLSEIDENLITAIEVLKVEAAVAIYGSRAADGVILVSMIPGVNKEYLKEMGRQVLAIGAPEPVPGNSLRQNFRDYAFWKPRLMTDKNGQARFDATFPDDITGWNASVIAMASKRRTGQGSTTLQSYKPVMAQIAQPNFLIEGDRSTAIGKITNYTTDTLKLQRTISVNDIELGTDSLYVENSRTDSISLYASGIDSIRVRYAVAHGDYRDGELRRIPVHRRGVMEAAGIFTVLDRDTILTIDGQKSEGEWKVYAQTDPVELLMDEILYLKNYPYGCNEQLASRIRALLVEKQIQEYRNERFRGERDLLKALRKLVSHQNADGSWGWWGTGEGEAWITVHVAQTLMLAGVMGYGGAFNLESTLNYLGSVLSDQRLGMRLKVYQFLLQVGEKPQIEDIAPGLRSSETASIHDKLMAERLLQLQGEEPDWNWINSVRSETIKGNFYWGEIRHDLADNAIVNTLIVYHMGVEAKLNEKELSRIRNYFLEQRARTWRNTYESSLILEALLPTFIDSRQDVKASLRLSGGINEVVDTFPFETNVTVGTAVTVAKSGLSPVYFTAYRESWNPEPKRSDTDFGITTLFEGNVSRLAAGKPVKLNVLVEVKKDAEYVMIEVPIPAGCSYATKSQERLNGEVHREYFNNKTNIFCRYLRKGIYEYSIDLLPRYSGTYTLNPAVVEWMYFPTLYGREIVKQVTID